MSWCNSALEKIQHAVGLSDNWPEFYSQLEHAVRHGWLHFRVRAHAHAYLTESSRQATSLPPITLPNRSALRPDEINDLLDAACQVYESSRLTVARLLSHHSRVHRACCAPVHHPSSVYSVSAFRLPK